jgi:hypothetical protein
VQRTRRNPARAALLAWRVAAVDSRHKHWKRTTTPPGFAGILRTTTARRVLFLGSMVGYTARRFFDADRIDDCMDAGGRATPGAVAEARAAGQATARDGGRYDCMDAEGRAAPGAAAESNAGAVAGTARFRTRHDSEIVNSNAPRTGVRKQGKPRLQSICPPHCPARPQFVATRQCDAIITAERKQIRQWVDAEVTLGQ